MSFPKIPSFKPAGVCLLAALPLFGPMQAMAQSAADIEALQQQIEQLQQQIEELRRSQDETAKAVKKAPAATTASGNDKVKLSISGQVNRGVLITDDGENTDAFFVDNDNSSTRIRLIGEAKPGGDLKVGTNIELQFESNSTAAVNQRNERNVGPNNFTERKLELYFDHASLGRLTIGQGDTASNSTSEVDLSGTTVVGYSGIADLAGGILFRDNDTLSNVTVGSTFSNFDGLSRDDRIRYDSPSLAGLTISGSLVADERSDVALRYSRDFSGTKFAAAVAYANKPNSFDQFNGSASVLLANGISLTGAAGTNDNDNRDDEGVFYYGKLGYEAQFFSTGKTAVAIDYHYSEDVGADGDETNSFGAFAVQNLDDFATELYLGYRRYDLDRNNANFDEIDALLTGARVKF